MSDLSRRDAIVLSALAASSLYSSMALAAADNAPWLDVPSTPPDPLSIPISVTVPTAKIFNAKARKPLTTSVDLDDGRKFTFTLSGGLLSLDSVRIGARLKIKETADIDRKLTVKALKTDNSDEIASDPKAVRITKSTCAPPLISTLRASVQPSYPKPKEPISLKFMTPQPPLDAKNEPIWWVKQVTVSYRIGAATDLLLTIDNTGRLLADELFLSFGIDKLETAGNVLFECKTTTDGTNVKDTIAFNIPILFTA
jgi:hypothetical protein